MAIVVRPWFGKWRVKREGWLETILTDLVVNGLPVCLYNIGWRIKHRK